MAALFRLSQGFAPRVLVASAAALFRRVVPRAPFDSLCEVIASGTTLDRDATVAALVRAGFSRSPVVEDAGTFAVRGAVIDLFPPDLQAPGPRSSCSATRSSRSASTTRRRSGRCARWTRVYLHPVRETIPTAGADPRAQHPGRRRRRGVSVVEDAAPARADRGGRAVLRHRGAGAGVPRAAWRRCSTTCPRRRAVRGRGSGGGARRGAPAGDAPARDGGVAPRRAPAGAARGGLRAGRGRGGARRWRRGGGSSCAPVEVVRVDPAADAPPRVRVESPSRTRRCARSCTRRASAARGAGQGEIDIGKPLRDRLRGWLDVGHRVRVVAPNRDARRSPGRRCCARSGLATDVAPPRRRRTSCSPARRARAAGRAERIAAARVRAAGRSAGRRRRGGDLRARARCARRAPARRAGARRSRRDRRGRRRRPRRARHRPLPRAQEADRARRARRTSCTSSTTAARSTCRSTGSALVHRYLGGEAGRGQARQAGRARPGRRSGGASRPRRSKIAEELMQLYAQRAALAGPRLPARPTRCSARSRRRSRSRRRPIRRRRSRRCWPTCRTACRWTA